ncbi:thioredoxin [Bacteroides sp. OM08-11]|nr:thioredoxin [Bacteroides sp. OM08-11]
MRSVEGKFKKEMEGVLDALQVDVDQESILAEFYKIDGTPTFILFRKAEQLWR